MEIKHFRNHYGLEIIPASNQKIILGDLVWDPLFSSPEFDYPGMPNNIFNAFKDADLIDMDRYQAYLTETRNIPFVEAEFSVITVNVDTDLLSSLRRPDLGQLNSTFSINNVKKFTFGDIQARIMPNILRVRIDDYLEELKKNNWSYYDGKIRRVFMITELYYGRINMVINKDLEHMLDTGARDIGMKVKNKLRLANSVEYTFDHFNVPFAMKIEKVQKFNG